MCAWLCVRVRKREIEIERERESCARARVAVCACVRVMCMCVCVWGGGGFRALRILCYGAAGRVRCTGRWRVPTRVCRGARAYAQGCPSARLRWSGIGVRVRVRVRVREGGRKEEERAVIGGR